MINFLLERNSPQVQRDMKHLLTDLQKPYNSGYVVNPHGLSEDSWFLFEKQILRNLNKLYKHPELREYDLNGFGKNNSIEASPELLKWTTNHENKQLLDQLIYDDKGNDTWEVLLDNKKIGTVHKRNIHERLNNFNKQRQELYKKHNVEYPGDATVNIFSRIRVPHYTYQFLKQGNKLTKRQKNDKQN